MVDVSALAKRLTDVQWSWKPQDIDAAVASLDAAPVERVRTRSTYRLPEGVELDVYTNDGDVGFVEITLDAFPNPGELSASDYEDTIDEYFEKFENAVASAARVLGRPVFNDGAGNSAFPEDQEAVWLALWRLPAARFMIQQKHEDKELPIRLCIVIAPPL